MKGADHTYRTARRAVWVSLLGVVALAVGCTGVLQNLGAKWATNKISAVFDFDDPQREATRVAVDRAIAAAPGLLGRRLDLLVATVDRTLAKGMDEQRMLVIERQVDILMDKAVAWIVDEAAPILATLREEQVDHAERELLDADQIDHMSERLHEMHATVKTLLGTGGG